LQDAPSIRISEHFFGRLKYEILIVDAKKSMVHAHYNTFIFCYVRAYNINVDLYSSNN